MEEPHLLEKVEVVVARETIGPDTDPFKFRVFHHGRGSDLKKEIAPRTKYQGRVLLPQLTGFFPAHLHHVDERDPGPFEKPRIPEICDWRIRARPFERSLADERENLPFDAVFLPPYEPGLIGAFGEVNAERHAVPSMRPEGFFKHPRTT